MPTIRQPEVTAALRAAGVTAGLTPEKLLFVGQQLTGTAVAGALTSNIGQDGAEDTLYGSASPLAAAIRRARRRNGQTQFDAIGLGQGSTAATSTLTITGPATEDGTFTLYIGSKKFNSYPISVTDTDTATVIGDAVVTAVTADANAFVTAANVAGVVTFTAKTLGTFGNTIGTRVEGTVAGVTNVLTAMAGGATDPSLTSVFDVVGTERYQGIVWQFSADTTVVVDFLNSRFNVTNDVLDGRGFIGLTDTFANHLVTLGTYNSHEFSIMVDKLVADADHQGPGILEIPFVKAAEFAAIRALRRTQDAVLGDLVISRSALDSFGGPQQNSKPYFNSPFADLLLPDPLDTFTDVEVEQLLAAGGWVVGPNRARTANIAGEVVTTYKTDNAGNPDPTFTFLNYVDTGSACREYIVNNTRAKYAQYRATTGALIPNVDSANTSSVATFVVELYNDLAGFGLVNTGVGGDGTDFDRAFQDALTVTLNPVTGRFSVSAKLFIVVQLRAVSYDLAIAFEV